MISPSNYMIIIIGLVYPCLSRSVEWSSKWEKDPSSHSTATSQQGRPSFSETRCTGSGFLADQPDGTWWRFPVRFFGPRNQWSKGCLKRYESNFAAKRDQKGPWKPGVNSLHPVFEASLFANGLRRVEWSWTIHWHGIHMTLTWRLSRLSEQALGYGIFALLLCPRSLKNIGHGPLGTAVMVSHCVWI